MKKFLNFLQYHNFTPLLILVLVLGAGSAFAMTDNIFEKDNEKNTTIDASLLLDTDLEAFDFAVTVSGVVETDTHFVVGYVLTTLAPAEGGWTVVQKTGEFSLAKDSLDQTGLEGAVVKKLRDLEAGERAYLARAQAHERAIASQNTPGRSLLSSLIGKQPDDIHVSEPERPYFEMPEADTSVPEEDVMENDEEDLATSTPSVATSTATQIDGNGTSTSSGVGDAASSTSSTQIQGCMDETALNYDPGAVEDDGTCEYPEPEESDEAPPAV